ncbi:MAG: hypothetical protein ACK4RV_04695 [Caulobacter sp.]
MTPMALATRTILTAGVCLLTLVACGKADEGEAPSGAAAPPAATVPAPQESAVDVSGVTFERVADAYACTNLLGGMAAAKVTRTITLPPDLDARVRLGSGARWNDLKNRGTEALKLDEKTQADLVAGSVRIYAAQGPSEADLDKARWCLDNQP